ncbi:putative lipoprotein [Streptomyces spiroverticillatus]|uniref:Lipoprotein n=1 Tax=Streptomyces finlayi TaxID=67296 RepID=A0A918WT20_9ACTN|nr:hypothetical protein [Streptomyces finlayi]GGZ89066.1 putative lipoprotein [Streptomyces spiroverticillatus]GHC79982.1 putative lipoprotein [Streptomyces finlayi]
MNAAGFKRMGISAVALAAVVSLAGCQGEGAKDGQTGKKAAGESAPQKQDRAGAARTLKAAYRKTAEAKSAKVKMSMSMPASVQGGGTMEMSGTLGWDPTVLDMTMKPTGALAPKGGDKGPDRIRMIMRDNVMYMDLGAKAAAEMDGKRWMKMDLNEAAKAGGGAGALTGGMDNANQDPSRQIGMLLESPNLQHVGAENVGGVATQHYKGTLTVAEMLKTNKDADRQLTGKEREELLANMNKAGIKGYDTDVWVDDKGYPAKMVVGMDSAKGRVNITMTYTDYGTKASVEVPPADQTLDFVKKLKEEMSKGGSGASARL